MADPRDPILRRASDLSQELLAMRSETGHIGIVSRYLQGKHDPIYVPPKAQPYYRSIAANAVTNWLPNVSGTFSRSLYIDGYRSSEQVENARPWEIWQANGMDARQSVAIRGAIEYGVSYGLVAPSGGKIPYMRPLRPTRTIAIYEDDDDEFPIAALYLRGKTIDGDQLWDYYEPNIIYHLVAKDANLHYYAPTEEHRMGVPWVRFRNRLGGGATGVIRPLIPLQNRVNEIVFNTQMALQYAKLRQRWATGLQIMADPVTGESVEPFKAAVDQVWTSDSPDTKFGDFSQTDVRGHLDTYNTTVRTMAALGYIAPDVLTGDLVNLSAEALLLKKETTQFQIREYQTLFGESMEQWLRLAAFAAGDTASALDMSAQARWRDTENRPLQATVDALAVMATTLQVPVEALWEEIPGTTDGDVARWKKLSAAQPQLPLAPQESEPDDPQEGTE